jgi:hypothetical protein
VLTVSGDIGTANKSRTLQLDLDSLERMRQVGLEAAEPFLKRRVLFEGVLLSDVLAVAGVPDSASMVSLTALDDYKVDFKVADVRSSQMLLATKADGKHMPVDRSGPIRIVFPSSSPSEGAGRAHPGRGAAHPAGLCQTVAEGIEQAEHPR